jgi:hypothetical protein
MEYSSICFLTAVAYSGESLNRLDNFVNTKKKFHIFASNSKPYIE